MDHPNLTRELVRHAQRLREPVRLAMAFKSQNPDWGSQATLVSIGVAGYLHDLDWNLTQVTDRFPSWHEEARAYHDPHLLLLRATQSHALSVLVEHPRQIRLRPVPEGSSEQRLWHRLASYGLTLYDAQQLAPYPALHPRTREWLPDIVLDKELHNLWELHHDELPAVQLDDFFDAVHPEDQGNHPNVLYHSVVQHWRTLGKLADPFLERTVGKTHKVQPLLPTVEEEAFRAPRRGLKA